MRSRNVKYEVYTFKHGNKTWKKKFSCLTDAVRYAEVLPYFILDIQIFNSKGERLHPPVPGETIP